MQETEKTENLQQMTMPFNQMKMCEHVLRLNFKNRLAKCINCDLSMTFSPQNNIDIGQKTITINKKTFNILTDDIKSVYST